MTELASILISHAFELRNIIHKKHLQSKKYNEHNILKDYYLKIIELTDEFAENYQGKFNLLVKYPEVRLDKNKSPYELISEFNDYLNKVRNNFTSEIQSSLDDIQNLNNSTLYLLNMD